MPEISQILGIVIGIFYSDHGVPHFHAVYGEHEISAEIESGAMHGEFPPRALRLFLGWKAPHKQEFLADWELARQGQPLNLNQASKLGTTQREERRNAVSASGGDCCRTAFLVKLCTKGKNLLWSRC